MKSATSSDTFSTLSHTDILPAPHICRRSAAGPGRGGKHAAGRGDRGSGCGRGRFQLEDQVAGGLFSAGEQVAE